MENQWNHDDWYSGPGDRGHQARHRRDRNTGRPHRGSGIHQQGSQDGYGGPDRQGRAPDLHASHPYDYTLRAKERHDQGAGYFSPPPYPARQNQDWHASYPGQDHHNTRFLDNRHQDRWSDDNPATYEERQDYIRNRDRHHHQRWESRFPGGGQHDFERRSPHAPQPPNRYDRSFEEDNTGWGRRQGRDRLQDDSPQRNQGRHPGWKGNGPQPGFYNRDDRAGQEARPWSAMEEARRRRDNR